MKKNLNEIKISGYDDFFKTDEIRQEVDKVIEISIDQIKDFPNHPFHVKDDDIIDLIKSVSDFGVLVPTIVRPMPDGTYEMVSGHRRKRGALLAGLDKIPCIVKNLTDDEAIIAMVDSNLQREQILPSEKAFAYKLKMEAIKRSPGRPKRNLSRIGTNKRTDEILAEQVGESRNQVERYIRLTNLIPPLLQMVDNKKMAFNPAVEISYLTKKEQEDLLITIESENATPTLLQAELMHRLHNKEELDIDRILKILSEEKPNQKEQIKIPKEKISKYFPRGTDEKTIEATIIKALELLQRKERKKENIR